MPLKRFVKLPSPQSVAASSTATFELPRGVRYHAVQLTLGASASPDWDTMVDEIRVKVDGRIQRRFTPTELDGLNNLNGSRYDMQGSDTILTIYFAEPWRRTLEGENVLAWGTGGIASLQIEIDINATPTSPTLSGKALIDDQLVAGESGALQPFPIGQIVKYRKINFPAGNVGENFLQSLPLNPGDAYFGIHNFSSDISDVEVKVDNLIVLDALKTEYDALLTSRGKVPVSGRYDIMFDLDDQVGSRLPVVKQNGQRISDFQVIYTMATGNPFNVITRVLGPID